MDDIAFHLLELNNKGYCCSQILMILALREQGKANPDLVRSLGGLGLGIGTSEHMCGALSGAACLLSFYAGKGRDDEKEDERLPLMIGELVEWFHEKIGGDYGGVRCKEILEDTGQGPDMTRCGMIVVQTYQWTKTLLENHGFAEEKGGGDED
jgi:C_GCAxxG_C_C family probable redox protein